jgi:hemerythrin-like metal-binding protein
MNKDIKYVEWSDALKVNIKTIDKQHKHFIGMMDRLFKAMQSTQKGSVPEIINELVAYAQLHFATEQGLFIKYEYPGAKEHIAEHQKIQKRVNEFLDRKYEDPLKLGYDLLDLLEDWLFKHIVTWDIKYAKVFKEKGLS